MSSISSSISSSASTSRVDNSEKKSKATNTGSSTISIHLLQAFQRSIAGTGLSLEKNEYPHLDIETLKTKLKEAEATSKDACVAFDQACQNRRGIPAALRIKKAASLEVVKLKSALEAKGVELPEEKCIVS